MLPIVLLLSQTLSWLYLRTQRFGDWILSVFLPEEGVESSLRNFVFFKYKQDGLLDKNRTIDNVQKHSIRTDVLSSQTFRNYFFGFNYIKSTPKMVQSFNTSSNDLYATLLCADLLFFIL
jgi:hypothetical protein